MRGSFLDTVSELFEEPRIVIEFICALFDCKCGGDALSGDGGSVTGVTGAECVKTDG